MLASMTHSRLGATLLIAAALALTGCAAQTQPSQEEIEERFAIEITSLGEGLHKDDAKVRELAELMSEDAAEDCHDPSFWDLQRDDLKYVHAAACLVLYDDLDPDLKSEYERAVVENAMAE